MENSNIVKVQFYEKKYFEELSHKRIIHAKDILNDKK